MIMNLSEKNQAEYVEYPIERNIDGYKYMCQIEHMGRREFLHELPSIVGFAGVKFRHDDGTDSQWYFSLYNTFDGKGTPATPIAARFYVKESK